MKAFIALYNKNDLKSDDQHTDANFCNGYLNQFSNPEINH